MRVIDGTDIKINRGDILPLELTIPISDEENYIFKVGDKIRFAVYRKKGYDEEPLIEKNITVDEETEAVNFVLTKNDTKIGDYINKPVTYWYEVELNDQQTIIGYDDDGAKLFILYPEGREID